MLTAGLSTCRNIYAVSDLHVEHRSNMDWVESLSHAQYGSDVLICAGDVADRLETFEVAMQHLVRAFHTVFYTPGNHELWLRRDGSEGRDSLDKLRRLDSVCRRLGVVTSPQRVQLDTGGVHVCPLVSFHHTSFDTEPDVAALRLPSVQRAMADWRACRFPSRLECGSETLAEHIDRYNLLLLRASAMQARGRPALTPWRSWTDAIPHREQRAEPLITFSHFLPRIELCPEKRFLRYPDL